MPLYLQSAVNGCPSNAFSELKHHHVLYCTICSMTKKVQIYPIHPQGQSLSLELTNDKTYRCHFFSARKGRVGCSHAPGRAFVAASNPKVLSLLLSLSGVTPLSLILPFVSSGEKRDMNFSSVALDSLVPQSVLHDRMTWGCPFHLAVSPQTFSPPNFPIHSLWETLGGTD